MKASDFETEGLRACGDVDLYSFANQKIRRGIKHDATVQELIALLWSVETVHEREDREAEVRRSRRARAPRGR